MTHAYPHLLAPFQLTPAMTLKNHIVMAPMTRVSATEEHIPTMEMSAYYAKRADAGLIITEGTIISPNAKGHQRVPGIFNAEQINGWKTVTRAIHDRCSRAFMQLWHVGRVSHPVLLNGQLPVSASVTTMTGKISRMPEFTYGTSREASIMEIQQIVHDFAQAAENAIEAGFDGIEIHGANGYLVDQFLHYHTNHRKDDYGATPENMARFALEIVHACGKRIGYDRVSIRLSPGAYLNEITGDPRDAEAFRYLLAQLNTLPIAYIHVGNFDDKRIFSELNELSMSQFMRQHYHGTLIGCGSYTIAEAEQALADDQFDLIAFGRPFIANPNLVTLIQEQQPIMTYDVSMLATLN